MADKSGWTSLLSALVSVADPELRKLGERLAGSISEDSWLRSEAAERALGAFKGWLESQGKGLHPVASLGIEKFTDILDFAAEGMFGKRGTGPAAISGWMNQFFKEASKRLAQTDDPTGEYQKLELEFELRLMLLKLIEEKQKAMAPPPPSSPPKPINWRETWEKVKNGSSSVDRQVAGHLHNLRHWLRRRGVR